MQMMKMKKISRMGENGALSVPSGACLSSESSPPGRPSRLAVVLFSSSDGGGRLSLPDDMLKWQ